ncbi:MAG TPA: methionine adenosyltransferase [Myxococcota bacterium]|nr:methionine adenosyltransferase [Myxococcota bacterium]
MPEPSLRPLPEPPADARPFEVVERKGLGHPDSICDALAEELSLTYSRHCLSRFGAIPHHNVDKALLRAGRSAPRFGGGEILEPMEILIAGRAAVRVGGESVPLEELAERSARSWLAGNLRGLDAERHVRLRCLVGPGSAELVDLFGRGDARAPLANDTSCGCGHAPFSELEWIVYEVERALSGAAGRALPGAGTDVKVMGVRRGERIALTIGCAARGPALPDADAYRALRAELARRALVTAERRTKRELEVRVNAADDDARGVYYLTVTGTSAEAGDDGQAGRGNRANGLITPGRPMTLESVAGKNPITHVGKLYNVCASLLAQALVDEIEEVREAECVLVSRIGQPIDDPQIAELRLRCDAPEGTRPWQRAAELARAHLRDVPSLWRELLEGRVGLDRWPLRI